MRTDVIVATPGLDEKSMQAERLGIGAACHGAKGRIRRFTITGKLRRLCAEEQRQRFGWRDAFGFGGVLARGNEIA